MSWEAKSCVFVRNKSIIKAFLTSNHYFRLKYKSFIYNIAFTSCLVWIRTEICTDQAPFTSNNSPKLICGRILKQETTGDGLFQCRKRYYGLWIILERNNTFDVKNNGFFSYKRNFTRCQLMDWGGVDYLWIIVMFLSAVWTLILTAPIHCRGSIGEQVTQCYISPNLFSWRNKLIYILNGLNVHFNF